MSEITYVINEFEKEVIIFNTITCLRLFELGNDPTLLYLFYIKTAKIQGTKSVYATNSFCRKGLGWGKTRFENAKRILIEEKLVENITKKDEKGQVIGHYIRIHYLRNAENLIKSGIPSTSPVSQKVDSSTQWIEPPSGHQEPNTINKNINTINKNINTINKENTVAEEIFSFWNEQNIIKHNKLTEGMKRVINKATEFHSIDEIKDAIKNYSTVINSSIYFFSYKWTILEFFQRGVSKSGRENNKGYLQFLSENKPLEKFSKYKDQSEIEQLRLKFKPISVNYSMQNILDKEKNTYYGFETDKLKNNFLMKEYESDIREHHNNGTFSWGYFTFLETLIASLFFNRKSGYDLELVKALMSIWNEKKTEFREIAIELL